MSTFCTVCIENGISWWFLYLLTEDERDLTTPIFRDIWKFFYLNFYETSLYIFIKIAQESLDLSAFRILFKLISWSKYSLMDSE